MLGRYYVLRLAGTSLVPSLRMLVALARTTSIPRALWLVAQMRLTSPQPYFACSYASFSQVDTILLGFTVLFRLTARLMVPVVSCGGGASKLAHG